jgi:glucokinase
LRNHDAKVKQIILLRKQKALFMSFPTTDYPDINKFEEKLTECIAEFAEENGAYESIRSVSISCPSSSYKKFAR